MEIAGSDTLGHIAEWFVKNEGRTLDLPNLKGLGLGAAYQLVHRQQPMGWSEECLTGTFAAASEISTGKDTPSGHWEMAGVPVNWEWAYYPDTQECFPRSLLSEIYSRSGLEGSLANRHASGTVVIEEFGGESVRDWDAHLLHFGRLSFSNCGTRGSFWFGEALSTLRVGSRAYSGTFGRTRYCSPLCR